MSVCATFYDASANDAMQYEKIFLDHPAPPFSQKPAMYPRQRRCFSHANIRKLRGILLSLAFVFIFLYAVKTSSPQTLDRWAGISPDSLTYLPRPHPSAKQASHGPKTIAKATMLYGKTNEFLEKAIASHALHNARFGYPMAVMRRSVTNGYWNKLSHLLSLIILELGRPESDRLKWIFWTNPDKVLLNPHVPLSAFLPPSSAHFTNLHFLGSRTKGELDSSAFFLRVSSWSVHFLIKSMAVPLIDPAAELGTSMDSNAMAFILNETEFSAGAIYMPRHWLNARHMANGFEGTKGSLLAEFPPDLAGERWKQMSICLEDVAARKWEVPMEETRYPREIQAFWERAERSMDTLYSAKNVTRSSKEEMSPELEEAIERLEEIILWELDTDGRAMDAIMRVEQIISRL